MLISKRPIKLAVAAVSLAAIAAMSAPPAVAASTPHDTAISPQDRAILTEQQMPGSPLGLPSEAAGPVQTNYWLSLIHISEPTRRTERSRMPSSA